MPTRVEWRKTAADHCSPTNPDALRAWRERGPELVGLTISGCQAALSPFYGRETCPNRVARFLWHVVNVLRLSEPPEHWPRGYCEPGRHCPDPVAVGQAGPVLPPTAPAPSAGVPRPGIRNDGIKITDKVDRDAGTRDVHVRAQHVVMNIDDLCRVSQVDLDTWRVVDHGVKTWPTTMKGADGEPRVVRNWGVHARFEYRSVSASAWNGVAVASPMPRQVDDAEKPDRCAFFVPDSQHGFRWDTDRRRLLPIHDRAACDVVLQAIAETQPDEIVLLGDMLDLAEWSTKYPRPADLRDTTQPTLYELHAWIAEMRATCPSARIVYLEGNHEDRVRRFLTERANHVADLKAVGDEREALALSRLLALDDIGVEYAGPYGASLYLSDRIRATHGNKVRSKGGATVTAVAAEMRTSTVFGHVHRVAQASRTVYGPRGRQVLTAVTPGCLCDLDRTPAAASDLDWQQGFARVWYGDGYESWELHQIVNGATVLGGRQIVGRDRGDYYAEVTGLPHLGA